MNKKEAKYWIWFSRLRKVNCLQKEMLLKLYVSPEKIWNLEFGILNKIQCLDKSCINEILDKKYRCNLDEFEEYLNKNNIQIITIFDQEYPEKLRNIYDKPVMLFAKGNLNLLKQEGFAIVGSRNCSQYGKEMSFRLAYDLAKNNKLIISGLAKGVDRYAHIGALEAGGNTIAVLGNGLDYIYPYENKNLYEKILHNNGLIITEYVIGTRPEKMNFPERNRLISGLSDGIIVVEASKKSGSLITADFGLEQGKDIFAVPGNANSLLSVGTNELIKQGAGLVMDYKDIIVT